MIDLVIYDTIGAPQPWDKSKALGGSEMQMVLLAEGLREFGYSVQITNRDEPTDARAVLVSRYTPLPKFIGGMVHTLVTDQETYPVLNPLFVSNYQRDKWGCKSAPVMPSFIMDEVYDLRDLQLSKVLGQWIYASALHKGFNEVLRRVDCGDHPNWSQLVVTNTYTDEPPCSVRPGVRWLGKTTSYGLARFIARARGLFYPHTYPECFPGVVHLAKLMGCRVYAPCVGHERCGVQEAMDAPVQGRPFSNKGPALDAWIKELGL